MSVQLDKLIKNIYLVGNASHDLRNILAMTKRGLIKLIKLKCNFNFIYVR